MLDMNWMHWINLDNNRTHTTEIRRTYERVHERLTIVSSKRYNFSAQHTYPALMHRRVYVGIGTHTHTQAPNRFQHSGFSKNRFQSYYSNAFLLRFFLVSLCTSSVLSLLFRLFLSCTISSEYLDLVLLFAALLYVNLNDACTSIKKIHFSLYLSLSLPWNTRKMFTARNCTELKRWNRSVSFSWSSFFLSRVCLAQATNETKKKEQKLAHIHRRTNSTNTFSFWNPRSVFLAERQKCRSIELSKFEHHLHHRHEMSEKNKTIEWINDILISCDSFMRYYHHHQQQRKFDKRTTIERNVKGKRWFLYGDGAISVRFNSSQAYIRPECKECENCAMKHTKWASLNWPPHRFLEFQRINTSDSNCAVATIQLNCALPRSIITKVFLFSMYNIIYVVLSLVPSLSLSLSCRESRSDASRCSVATSYNCLNPVVRVVHKITMKQRAKNSQFSRYMGYMHNKEHKALLVGEQSNKNTSGSPLRSYDRLLSLLVNFEIIELRIYSHTLGILLSFAPLWLFYFSISSGISFPFDSDCPNIGLGITMFSYDHIANTKGFDSTSVVVMWIQWGYLSRLTEKCALFQN